MPRYRFTAVDSYGTAHDGTIDAATEDAARNKLASNGLSVRSVEEVAAPPGTEPPEVPRRAAPKSSPDGSAVIPRRARPFEAADGPAGRRSPWPLVLSLLALFVSLGTAAYTLVRGGRESDPLSKYDFRSPEAALHSEIKMASTGDLTAQMKHHQRSMAKEFREKLDTFRIHNDRTKTSRGKTVVFFEYDDNGIHRQEAAVMERDEDGSWRRSIRYQGGQGLDPQVLLEIQRWQTSGMGVLPGRDGGHGGGDGKADW